MTINRIDMEEITDRIDELRGERADLETDRDDTESEAQGDHPDAEAQSAADEAWAAADRALKAWDDENGEELAELEELLEELRGAGGGDHQWEGDWYPRELIDADDFEEYAEELASDCYDIPDTWPHRCIDWAKAARELSQDYSMVSFRGSDYYWR